MYGGYHVPSVYEHTIVKKKRLSNQCAATLYTLSKITIGVAICVCTSQQRVALKLKGE